MPKMISANLDAAGLRLGLVASRFNEFIVSKLVEGATAALLRHHAADDDLTIVWTPGAFELPLAAKKLAEAGRFDAIVCLGCVLRGQTAHFDYIAGEAAKGVAQVALETGTPISFGVLTPDTLEQAIDRAGGKHGNKGAEAALAAVEMANLSRALSS